MESCEKKIKREKKKSRVGVRPFAISLPSRPIASASTICCLLNRRGRRTTYEQPLYKESARKGVDGREGGREGGSARYTRALSYVWSNEPSAYARRPSTVKSFLPHVSSKERFFQIYVSSPPPDIPRHRQRVEERVM